MDMVWLKAKVGWEPGQGGIQYKERYGTRAFKRPVLRVEAMQTVLLP